MINNRYLCSVQTGIGLVSYSSLCLSIISLSQLLQHLRGEKGGTLFLVRHHAILLCYLITNENINVVKIFT